MSDFEERLRQALREEHSDRFEIGTHEKRPVCITTEDLKRHAHFIGPTGTGKTRALCLLLKQIIDKADSAVIVLDPLGQIGGLYHTLKAHCYTNCSSRLITLDPGDVFDLDYACGFNPLLQGVDPAVQAAFGVEHLQATIHDEQLAQPTGVMLRIWGFRLLLGLISSELAMADAAAVLSPNAGLSYRAGLADVLDAKYPEIADHWRRFVEDTSGKGSRASQEYDRVLGSTTRRIETYLQSRSVRFLLSSTRRALDFDRILRERGVLLVNLGVRDFLKQEDQQLLGMQIVHEVCRAVKAQREVTAPCYLALDEFQNFLTPDLYDALNFGRNYNLRLLIAHQFLNQLVTVAGQEWRIFHSVMSNATVKLVFGGLPPDDRELLAQHLYGAYLDPFRVKQEIWRTIQLHHVEETVSRGRTSGRGGSSSWSHSSSAGSSGSGQGGREIITSVEADSTAGMLNYFDVDSETRSMAVVPDPPTQELSSREYIALAEQLWEYSAKMARLSPQHAVLQVNRSEKPIVIRIADSPPPAITLPQLSRFDAERFPHLLWVSPLKLIEEEARDRLADFARRRALALPPAPTKPSGAERRRKQAELVKGFREESSKDTIDGEF